MKRNLKNIIMITIIIITLICWCITIKSLSNNSSNMPNRNNMEADNGGTPPAKLEGDTNSDNNNTPPEMQNTKSDNGIETKYYIAFGIESFIISASIIYLIISRFNSKKFNEILTGKCIILSLILIIAFTAILTYSSGVISNKYFINNKQ